MKLCRYGDAGAERPGLVDGDGNLRDLSGVVADIDAAVLSEQGKPGWRRWPRTADR